MKEINLTPNWKNIFYSLEFPKSISRREQHHTILRKFFKTLKIIKTNFISKGTIVGLKDNKKEF